MTWTPHEAKLVNPGSSRNFAVRILEDVAMTYLKSGYLAAWTVVLGALSLQPVSAETLSGWINGHDCAEQAHACPIDKLDPHVQLESDFVLVVGDEEYYFLTNLSRDLKVRHVLDKVMVVGDVNKKYNSVDVSELKVREGDDFKTVWSKAMVAEEQERLCKAAKAEWAQSGDSRYSQSRASKQVRHYCGNG
jgi:hypothetical protein